MLLYYLQAELSSHTDKLIKYEKEVVDLSNAADKAKQAADAKDLTVFYFYFFFKLRVLYVCCVCVCARVCVCVLCRIMNLYGVES